VPAQSTSRNVERSRTLPHTSASVPLGRRLVRAWLRLTPSRYDVDTVMLLVSELLSYRLTSRTSTSTDAACS
jgi:hypothetical protein